MAVRDIKEAEYDESVKSGKVIVDFWARGAAGVSRIFLQ